MGSNISAIASNGGIVDLIQSIERGEFLLDLEEACSDVVDKVQDTGKPGEVVIKIRFGLDASTDTMRVSGNVVKKLPQKPTKASIFFITPEGNLSRLNTKQTDMFRSPAEVKASTIQFQNEGDDNNDQG